MPNFSPLLGAVRRGLPLVLAAFLTTVLAALPVTAAARDELGQNMEVVLTSDNPRIPLTPAPPPPPPPPPPTSIHDILLHAAADQGVDPNLFLAVSFWESGWHQDRVSSEGAIGLLQVMPNTAKTAGPALLHRTVDINNPLDNAEVGAALLRDLLDHYSTRTALAAYYQGEPALLSGRYAADTWHYADSIIALAAQISAGQGPPVPA